MIVSVNSAASELVKDSASMLEILNALVKRMSSFNKKQPDSLKAANFVKAVITHGKVLNDLAKETYKFIASTSSAPLLHPEILSKPADSSPKYHGGLMGALKHMQDLVKSRKSNSQPMASRLPKY
jgi:hypothetical protein